MKRMIIQNTLKISFVLFLWLLVFQPIFPELYREWISHSDNSHAFLVPFVSLFLLWRKRAELARSRMSPSAAGGFLLAAALTAYLVGYAGGIAILSRLAMIASLAGLLWTLLGTELIKKMAFPLFFLLFLVPVPYSILGLISMPLQLLATRLSADIIQGCAIPVYREGNMLFFVQTQLEVAEACSGIRSIMSLTMLGTIFAYFVRGGWGRRLILVAAAVPIALFANIARVSGTGILAHLYGDRVARGFLHDLSGLVVFLLGFLLLLLTFSLLERSRPHGC